MAKHLFASIVALVMLSLSGGESQLVGSSTLSNLPMDLRQGEVRVLKSLDQLMSLAYNGSKEWVLSPTDTATIRISDMSGSDGTDPSTWIETSCVDFNVGQEGTYDWSPTCRRLYRVVLMHEGVIETAYFNLVEVPDLTPVISIASLSAEIESQEMPCNGYPCRPKVSVIDGQGVALAEGEDYLVQYVNNVNVGTASARVVGKGDYDGISELQFAIVPLEPASVATAVKNELSMDLETAVVRAPDTADLIFPIAFNSSAAWSIGGDVGSSAVVSVSLMSGEEPFDPSTWQVSESVELTNEVGEATVVWVPAKQGLYRLNMTAGGSVATAYFNLLNTQGLETVVPIDGMDFEATLSELEFPCSGYQAKPTVTLTRGGVPLKEGVDYAVTYQSNVNVGIATVVIAGIGEYGGTITKTFRIVPIQPQPSELMTFTAGPLDTRVGDPLSIITRDWLFPFAYNDSPLWPKGGLEDGVASAMIIVAPVVAGEAVMERAKTIDPLTGEGTVRCKKLKSGLYEARLVFRQGESILEAETLVRRIRIEQDHGLCIMVR